MDEKTTVRSVTYDLLRSLGLTTVFGNPGSTEQTFLQEFPDDFSYILALQEASAIAMADAFAQVTGRPALVNLHSSAGVGNAMGNLVAAYHGNTPLIVTSGQQHRELMIGEPYLGNHDAEAVGEVVLRAVPGAGCAGGVHARLRDGAAAAGRTGLPVGTAGRLEPAAGRPGPRPDGEQPVRPRPGAAAAVCRPHLRQPPSRAGLRTRRGPQRRVGRGRRPGREIARRRLRVTAAGPGLLPGGPPPVPRAAGNVGEDDQRPAGRARPCRRDRRGGVPVLPLHSRRFPSGGRRP